MILLQQQKGGNVFTDILNPVEARTVKFHSNVVMDLRKCMYCECEVKVVVVY